MFHSATAICGSRKYSYSSPTEVVVQFNPIPPLSLSIFHSWRLRSTSPIPWNFSEFSTWVSLPLSILHRCSLGSSCNLPYPRTSAETKGTFLSSCLLMSLSRLWTLDPEKFETSVETSVTFQ